MRPNRARRMSGNTCCTAATAESMFDVERAPPDLDGVFVELSGRRPAGIGDQDADRPKLVAHRIDHGAGLTALGEITLREHCALAELLGRCRAILGIATVDRNPDPRFTERPRARESEALAAAQHKSDFACDAQIHALLGCNLSGQFDRGHHSQPAGPKIPHPLPLALESARMNGGSPPHSSRLIKTHKPAVL